MKNFVQPGKTFDYTAAADIESGAPVVVGALVLIAAGKILAGEKGVLVAEGVFKLAKEAPLAIAQGDLLYWDATNKVVTKTATDNTKIGFAHVAADSAATEVFVLLAH